MPPSAAPRGSAVPGVARRGGCRVRAARGALETKCCLASVPGECKRFQEKFMKCLRENKFENALCRLESKDYLECRMERQLMAQEPLEKLGFGDLMDGKADKH